MPRDSDAFCRGLLKTGGPQELSEWIRAENHALGELGHDESVALANAVYRAGAPHVYAVEIDEYPHGSNTGKLVVELPTDSPSRKRTLRWTAKIARGQGFDPDPDVGQQYVFVKLD